MLFNELESSVDSFRDRVCILMSKVPEGSVTTYGDLAGLAGHANASRAVGGIAHTSSQDLPWHRLVNRYGRLASGYHGGREEQKRMLESEGVSCSDYVVDNFNDLRWRPFNE